MDGGIVMATDALADLAMNEVVDAELNAAKQAGHVETVEKAQDADIDTFCAGLGLIVPPAVSSSVIASANRKDGVEKVQKPIE